MLEPKSSPSPDRPLSASYSVILSGLAPASPDDRDLLALDTVGFQPVVTGERVHEGLGTPAEEVSPAAFPVRSLSAKWLSTSGTKKFYNVSTVKEISLADNVERLTDGKHVRITTPGTQLFYGEHTEGRGGQTSSRPKVASPDESLYLERPLDARK